MERFEHRILKLTLAGALAAFSTTSVLAEPVMPELKVIDLNGDELVSLEEFVAKGGQELAFRKSDANRDNQLGRDEYTRARAHIDRVNASKYPEGVWSTAKVGVRPPAEKRMEGLGVSLETQKGSVQPSGLVNDTAQIAKNEKIAPGIEGEKGVHPDPRTGR
ncbi:MAG: hyperosmotically inducible periplasmic protein [Pseudomonadota bacterium]|nr:hyperosmotically inducible periplasmic protein [Pseudomonadota bacterium]